MSLSSSTSTTGEDGFGRVGIVVQGLKRECGWLWRDSSFGLAQDKQEEVGEEGRWEGEWSTSVMEKRRRENLKAS